MDLEALVSNPLVSSLHHRSSWMSVQCQELESRDLGLVLV